MHNQINNYCNTLCYYTNTLAMNLCDCFLWFGRKIGQIFCCIGTDRKVNAVREDILPTNIENQNHSTSNSIPIPQTPSISRDEPPLIQADANANIVVEGPPSVETFTSYFEGTQKVLSTEGDFDQNILNAVTNYLYFLSYDQQVNVVSIFDFAENPRTLKYLTECMQVQFPQEFKNHIAEKASQYLLTDNLAHNSYTYIILTICSHANHVSVGMFFAACMLNNVELIKACLSNQQVEHEYVNVRSFCALNFAHFDTLYELENEGLITDDLREQYWGCYFNNFKTNAAAIFASIPTRDNSKQQYLVPASYPGEPQETIYFDTMVYPNYSANYLYQKDLIVCAAPQHASVNTFWEMAKEADVDLIVQLETRKCHNYYPKTKDQLLPFGKTNVQLESQVATIKSGNITIVQRILLVDGKKVTHFEVQGWEDQTATSLIDLKILIGQITGMKSKKTLIHCLKGWGRAGTVATALGMHHYYRQKQYPIYLDSFLEDLRSERANLVLTPDQFKLLVSYNKLICPKPYPRLGHS